jgi:hypothetical protein
LVKLKPETLQWFNNTHRTIKDYSAKYNRMADAFGIKDYDPGITPADNTMVNDYALNEFDPGVTPADKSIIDFDPFFTPADQQPRDDVNQNWSDEEQNNWNKDKSSDESLNTLRSYDAKRLYDAIVYDEPRPYDNIVYDARIPKKRRRKWKWIPFFKK